MSLAKLTKAGAIVGVLRLEYRGFCWCWVDVCVVAEDFERLYELRMVVGGIHMREAVLRPPAHTLLRTLNQYPPSGSPALPPRTQVAASVTHTHPPTIALQQTEHKGPVPVVSHSHPHSFFPSRLEREAAPDGRRHVHLLPLYFKLDMVRSHPPTICCCCEDGAGGVVHDRLLAPTEQQQKNEPSQC